MQIENNNLKAKLDDTDDDNKEDDDELLRTNYFICDKFLKVCEEEPDHKQVCAPFFTSALSTDNIHSFFDNLLDRISAIYCFHKCPLCT